MKRAPSLRSNLRSFWPVLRTRVEDTAALRRRLCRKWY
jgi:hypothetical protein